MATRQPACNCDDCQYDAIEADADAGVLTETDALKRHYLNGALTRVRVRGGRHVHAVALDAAGIARTTCGSRRLRRVDRRQLDHDEPVTCPNCLRATGHRATPPF